MALRLARSELTRDWILAENDSAKKSLFFREAEGYRKDLLDRSLFIASALSGNYYFSDEKSARSVDPKYVLDSQKEENKWFYKTLETAEPYNINVAPDEKLGLTKVWLNFLVKDGDRNIALAGTGVDLTSFITSFVQNPEPGVQTMAIDENGYIQAHRDVGLIAYRAAMSKDASDKTLAKLLSGDQERVALSAVMIRAKQNPETAVELIGTMNGRRELLALSWSPQLNWFVVASVDLNVAKFFTFKIFEPLVMIGAALILCALLGYIWLLNRFLLKPITSLTKAAVTVASGDMDVKLLVAGNDELGMLTNAFRMMVSKVSFNRIELQRAFQFRTQELEIANKELAQIAERDELTGLGNRRMLQGHLRGLETKLRQAPLTGSVSVALLDADHFKASVGLAQNRQDEPIDLLIKRADAALYQAKDTGRNRVVLV